MSLRKDKFVVKAVAVLAGPLSILTVAVLLAGSPGKSQRATTIQARVVEGDVRTMGHGKARTWLRFNEHGDPSSLGITFDESAMEGLPDLGGKTCCDGAEYPLDLPKDVAGLPFTHVVINWNPHGHPPVGIYDKPHFDFHFYMQKPEDRVRITAEGEDLARATRPLPAAQVPTGYVMGPGGVPRMGAHWADTASGEFHGLPFTKTFVYGSYDGRITFVEPMVTRAFLDTKPDVTESLRLPAQFPQPGFYPTSYRIQWNATNRQYTISLEGLTRR